MVQLTVATVLSLIYLVIQQQLKPYTSESDNFTALAASFGLTMLFLGCLLLKLAVLMEQYEVRSE